MTVGEVRAMPNDEHLAWQVYFARQAQQQELAEKQARWQR